MPRIVSLAERSAQPMLAVAGLLALLCGGCGSENSGAAPHPTGTALADDQSAAAMLQNALLLLEEQRGDRRERYNDLTKVRVENEAIQARLRGLLNQWIIQADLADALVLSEVTEHVLRGFAQRGQLRPEQLEEIRFQRFTPEDARHIQACMYLAEIARHARGPEPDDLSRARHLFDWVVRNIQLVPADDSDRKGLLEFLGPAFQSPLLIGKGTELERARIFLLLLRQLRIQACYVGPLTPDGAFDPRWVAVLIGGELYLFDPTLGLPLPSEEQGSVATLREFAADPGAVLGRLGNDNAPDAKLAGMVLRLDADTAFWAPRMKLLESHTAGLSQPVVLYEELGTPEQRAGAASQTSGPRDLLDRLREAAGEPRQPFFANQPIGLVDVPSRLRVGLAPPGSSDPPAVFEALLFSGGYLGEARQLHLRGQWEEAIKSYQTVLRRYAEITADPLSHEFRDRYFAELAREMATYWVGLCKYEQGELEVAADNWLRPYLGQYPDGGQIHGARYLLARCLEAQAMKASRDDPRRRQRLEEAVELFGSTTSPQRSGDRVRARRLQKLLQ